MKKGKAKSLLKLKATYLMTGVAVLGVLTSSIIKNCNNIKEGENTSISISVIDEQHNIKPTPTITQEVIIPEEEKKPVITINNEEDSIPSIIAEGMNVNEFVIYNDRTIGTISIPGSTIHFPIVNSNDDNEWLNTNFNNDESIYGTIFLDYTNDTSFNNNVSTIFGHNMKDYRMFAGLNRYIESKSFYKNSKYAFISTEDYIYIYEFAFASRVPYDNNEIRKGNYKTTNEYDEYIDLLRSYAVVENDEINPYNHEPLLQLLTCCNKKDKRTAVYFSYLYKIPNIIVETQNDVNAQNTIKELTNNKKNYSSMNHNVKGYIINKSYNYIFIENENGNKYIWTENELTIEEKNAFINAYDINNESNYTFIFGYNTFNLNYSYISISENDNNYIITCEENTNLYVRCGSISISYENEYSKKLTE